MRAQVDVQWCLEPPEECSGITGGWSLDQVADKILQNS
jgi:hypothetical protein